MTKRITQNAMLVALALIFSYIEVLIPFSFGIPGVKLGLANLVIVTGIYLFKTSDVILISLIRIILAGFLFGNGASILYSLAGGVLSLTIMCMLKQCKGFSILGVSIAGGVAHNVGQLIAAVVVVSNLHVAFYGSILIIAGMLTGAAIGMVAIKILPAVKRANIFLIMG